jgi:hypothetical protein
MLMRVSSMRKLLKEIREIKRKLALSGKREGARGKLIRTRFTERETNLVIEMLTRRSRRDITADKTGHIFPEKMNRQPSNSTQKRAMELIRSGKWVV